MKAADMLARDLVLRVCGSDGEFHRDWLASGAIAKRAVPVAVSPGAGPDLTAAIAGAALEMGATRLLACRTRAAFMYDAVAVLPVSPQALLDLVAAWEQPDDFLVCLPDGSAAVLVCVAGYALAAGPPAFVAALAGPDVADARRRFTAWARESGDQRLRLVAGRYGSGPPSRHGPRRPPDPDLAERLSGIAADVRRRRPLATGLRAARSAAGWAAVAVIVTIVLSAPRASHVLPVLGGGLWLVLQVFALARTHTLSWAVCLRVMAAGAGCAAVFAAIAWLVAGARLLHGERALVSSAEEAVKLVPVAVFWLAAKNRFARLGAADFVLLGVASGAGFALTENTAVALTRSGVGWHLAAFLPGWSDAGTVRFPGHAVTTGLVTGAVGLALTARRDGSDTVRSRRGWWRWLLWLLPPVLFALAVLDHYHYDGAVAAAGVPRLVTRLHAAAGDGHASRWLLAAILVSAVTMDFAAQRRVADVVPPVPGVPLWSWIVRAARGSQIRARMRWSPRTLRGKANRWLARVRVAVAEPAASGSHEIAFLVVALPPRRRPEGVFAASLAFVRQRRELAMREARAGGKARRDVPRRDVLWAARQRLTTVLAAGGGCAAAAMAWRHTGLTRPALTAWYPIGRPGAGAAAARATAARVHAAPPAVRGGPPHAALAHGRPADVASLVPSLHEWFSQFITEGQVLIVLAAVGVIVLLVSGWVPPAPLGGRRGAGRPGRLLTVLGALPAPGNLVFGVLRLAGTLLPPATTRLLAGHGVARPYQRLPPARWALSAGGPLSATPQAPGEAAQATPRRPGNRELHLSGWLFPPERVRRWVSHATEFGLEPADAASGPRGDTELVARMTEVLRRIAGGANSLRLDDVTFRNHPARAVVDRSTGAAVFFTPAGEFTGCALLTEDQLYRLVTDRRL